MSPADSARANSPEAEAGAPVLWRVEDGVAVISLNNPARHNAVGQRMIAEYEAALGRAMAASEIRAIVFRGEGRSFCSGADVNDLGERSPDVSHYAFVGAHQTHRLSILEGPKPIVAAVRGYAIGGGLELALMADIRVAGESARFSLPEIGLGIIADLGGSAITTVIAGPSRAKYLLMTGDMIDAETALRWGLVDFLVPDDEVDALALNIARTIAAQPPLAIQAAKRLCAGVHGGAVRRGIREELLAISMLYATQDSAEARTSRREGRAPAFRGV